MRRNCSGWIVPLSRMRVADRRELADQDRRAHAGASQAGVGLQVELTVDAVALASPLIGLSSLPRFGSFQIDHHETFEP